MTEQQDELAPEVPIERGYCRLHYGAVPDGYPIQPRSDMAVRRPPVVATRPGQVLLCDSNHAGPHLWPDGDEAGEWPDAQGNDTTVSIPD